MLFRDKYKKKSEKKKIFPLVITQNAYKAKIMFWESFPLLILTWSRKEISVDAPVHIQSVRGEKMLDNIVKIIFLLGFFQGLWTWLCFSWRLSALAGWFSRLQCHKQQGVALSHCFYDWGNDIVQNSNSYFFCLSSHLSWLNICFNHSCQSRIYSLWQISLTGIHFHIWYVNSSWLHIDIL